MGYVIFLTIMLLSSSVYSSTEQLYPIDSTTLAKIESKANGVLGIGADKQLLQVLDYIKNYQSSYGDKTRITEEQYSELSAAINKNASIRNLFPIAEPQQVSRNSSVHILDPTLLANIELQANRGIGADKSLLSVVNYIKLQNADNTGKMVISNEQYKMLSDRVMQNSYAKANVNLGLIETRALPSAYSGSRRLNYNMLQEPVELRPVIFAQTAATAAPDHTVVSEPTITATQPIIQTTSPIIPVQNTAAPINTQSTNTQNVIPTTLQSATTQSVISTQPISTQATIPIAVQTNSQNDYIVPVHNELVQPTVQISYTPMPTVQTVQPVSTQITHSLEPTVQPINQYQQISSPVYQEVPSYSAFVDANSNQVSNNQMSYISDYRNLHDYQNTGYEAPYTGNIPAQAEIVPHAENMLYHAVINQSVVNEPTVNEHRYAQFIHQAVQEEMMHAHQEEMMRVPASPTANEHPMQMTYQRNSGPEVAIPAQIAVEPTNQYGFNHVADHTVSTSMKSYTNNYANSQINQVYEPNHTANFEPVFSQQLNSDQIPTKMQYEAITKNIAMQNAPIQNIPSERIVTQNNVVQYPLPSSVATHSQVQTVAPAAASVLSRGVRQQVPVNYPIQNASSQSVIIQKPGLIVDSSQISQVDAPGSRVVRTSHPQYYPPSNNYYQSSQALELARKSAQGIASAKAATFVTPVKIANANKTPSKTLANTLYYPQQVVNKSPVQTTKPNKNTPATQNAYKSPSSVRPANRKR